MLDSQANEAKNKILRSDNSSLSTKMKELEQELTSLVTERDILQKNINESESAYRKRIEVEKADIAIERSTYEASRNGLNELYLMAKEELVASNHKIIELEKDFEVLKKVKADCEEAMNLLDKDIHDKDDTIAALRKQCAEVKKLNLNMLGRVQSTEVAMCEKDSSLRQAEGRQSTASSQVTELTKQLETMTEQLEKTALELDEYKKKCYETEVKFEQVQTQYHVEKEWREQIQSQSIKDREDVARLRAELTHISEIKSTLKQVQRENEDLRRSCSEQERALIELGDHLSKSKERAEELKITTDVMKESKWTDDKDIENCQQCNKTFSVARRRHHCRNCGGIFCHQCSDNTMPLPSSARPLRVCDRCNDLLIQRYQAA